MREPLGYYALSGDLFAPVYAEGPDLAGAVTLDRWRELAREGGREGLLVSACLGGVRSRYDGGSRYDPRLEELSRSYDLVFVCPEVLGGLPTPRAPAEVEPGHGGGDVLDGYARVRARDGRDVTDGYASGARRALAIAEAVGARRALLMERSPSCGVRKVYDGTFSGSLREGSGVAAELLRRGGLELYGSGDIEELLALAQGER